MSIIKIMQLCLGFILVVFSATSLAAGPEEVLNTLEKSVNRAGMTGKESQKWQQERLGLIEELLDLELKDAWTRFQLDKMNRYLLSEEKNITVLEDKLARAEKTQNTLAPFLELLYLDLENHVNSDLPFARQERDRRLAFIRSCLDDSNVRLPEKFGRLLEAVQVECDYGYSVEVTKEIAHDIDGGSSQVDVLRIGRLGLFRIFTGNSRIQKYEKKINTWQDISPANAGELYKAMEIARKKRVTSVVTLPVGNFSDKPREERQKGDTI